LRLLRVLRFLLLLTMLETIGNAASDNLTAENLSANSAEITSNKDITPDQITNEDPVYWFNMGEALRNASAP